MALQKYIFWQYKRIISVFLHPDWCNILILFDKIVIKNLNNEEFRIVLCGVYGSSRSFFL